MTIAVGGVYAGTGIPSPPVNVIATSFDSDADTDLDAVQLTWMVGAGGGDIITEFIVTPYLAGNPQSPFSLAAGIPGSNLSPVPGAHDQTVILLLPNGSYAFTVAAVNPFGYGGASVRSNTVIVYEAVAGPAVQGSPAIPHLAAPCTLAPDGSFNWLQQDSLGEVTQSVEVILGSVAGRRTVVPTFGTTADLTFGQPDSQTLQQTVTAWDPRARTNIQVSYTDSGTANVRVTVALATGVVA